MTMVREISKTYLFIHHSMLILIPYVLKKDIYPYHIPNFNLIGELTIMKFIVSTFNPNKMVIDSNFDMEKRALSEEEFQALCFDAYSCVGYEDVALMLNVAHNKEPVKARIGDTLLFADMNKGVLEYSCIRICPPQTPLIREDEYLIDEEMI